MADETQAELEHDAATFEAIRVAAEEYQALRQQEIDAALGKLEDPRMQPVQKAAYEATLTEMLALPIDEVRCSDQDPLLPIARALEHAEQAERQWAEIEQRFGARLELESIRSLRRYTLAALHAFTLYRDNPEPPGSLSKLVLDAARARERLSASAEVLVYRKVLPREAVQTYDGGIVPEHIGCDLFLLVGVLRKMYPKVQGRVFYTQLELMEAEAVAKAVLQSVTQPQLHGALFWQPAVIYARAYTLVERAFLETETALAELYNTQQTTEEMLWVPKCVFCGYCTFGLHPHQRRNPSARDVSRRAQFVATTMTAVLGCKAVEN